ncbi:helix-turn-helix domain-containing protein [Pseudaquabacterium terrae]
MSWPNNIRIKRCLGTCPGFATMIDWGVGLVCSARGGSTGQCRSASKAADAAFQWRFIHPMHISRVDLNLVAVLESICTEGGITKAADRLHLTQPAISHALSRLR